MADWNARQYLKFDNERTQPARDLAARVAAWLRPGTAADLGCGPGNSTAVLREFFPDADLVGIDSSEEMLRRARADHPELPFAQGDVTRLEGRYDLLFSNACLQWIPDHQRLIPELIEHLNPGGLLAVQVPNNGEAPLYRVIREMAAEPGWGLEEVKAQPDGVLDAGAYDNILAGCAGSFQVWETIYVHRLDSHRALAEWVKGTRLRPYLDALGTEPRREDFLAELLRRITPLYPVQRDGKVCFPFRRLFFVAERAQE